MPQERNESPNEKEVEELYQNYRLIKESIVEWQQERGDYWAKRLTPSDSIPFYTISELPTEGILELAELLIKKSLQSEREISREEIESAIKQFLKGQTSEDFRLYSQLFMAVSGLLDLARQNLPKEARQKAMSMKSFSCPVCGQEEVLSMLVPPVGKRVLACKMCGHEWEAKRVGCIRCGSEEASNHVYLHSKEHVGVEIVACQDCGGSFKEFDLRSYPSMDLVWEDVKTLSLDYAAQRWLNEEAKKNGQIQ